MKIVLNNLQILNPLEQFEINSFLSLIITLPSFNGWTVFKISITNVTLFLMIVLTVVIFISTLGNNSLILGNGWTVLSEYAYDSLLSMSKDQIGEGYGKYFTLINGLFTFILLNNLIGMIPYSFTPTSHFALTLSFSVAIVIGVTIIGFQLHNIKFFGLFVPSGTPLALVPLLTLIESVSYLARAVSLGVRLGANMLAGHSLIKILSTFTWGFIKGSKFGIVIAVLPLLLITALTGLELGICALQAYVFTILTCSYIKDSIHLH